jgi:hypothetical protein
MCYELRFFRRRFESKQRAREETIARESERSPADAQPAERSRPEPAVAQKRKVERVYEDVN